MLFRTLQIVHTTSTHLVFYRLTTLRNEPFGVRLRLTCEKLGLTFIKIGQILSMRYDLLSDETCEELQKLLDSLPPLPFNTIRDILEREYNQPLEEVFASFDEIPIGSASVSQVHKAVLHSGETVAVKVKRPDVDTFVAHDIAILKTLVWVAQFFSPTLRHINATNVVNYFKMWLEKDLNFVREVKNMHVVRMQYRFGFGRPFRNDVGLCVAPKPYETWCAAQIIVMDFVENGISLVEKQRLEKDPRYDPQKSVRTYMNAAMRNWFQSDCYAFQGDPHLSNVLALPHGGMATIDAGLIEQFTPKQTDITRRLLVAVYLKDIEETIKISLAMAQAPYKQYRHVIADDIETYIQEAQQQGIEFWFMEIGRIFIKHRIPFPDFLLSFGRSMAILDRLVDTFFPGHTTMDIVGDELRKQAMLHLFHELKEVDPVPIMYAALKRVKEAPEVITNFIRDPASAMREVYSIIR